MTALQEARNDRNPADVRENALIPARRSGRVDELEHQIDCLRDRLRLAVVYGGDRSAQGAVIRPAGQPRSWQSYRAVAEDIAAALGRLGFRHCVLVPDDMRLGEVLLREAVHLAWLNTGGVQGYNPVCHAPAMLEMLGLPYLGHNPLTAGILDNKHIFKQELDHIEVPTAPFVTWHPARGTFRPNVNSRFLETFKDHWGSYVVKPVSGRESRQVHFVDEEAKLPETVARVFEATENRVLIEAYLPGREFSIVVGGCIIARQRALSRLSDPFAFAAVERVHADQEPILRLADSGTAAAGAPGAADLRRLDTRRDETVLGQLYEIARKVWVELSLESPIRLDLREDAEGTLHVLEANPIPDLTASGPSGASLVSDALPALGMDYDDLILALLADRLDVLFCRHRGAATHLTALLAGR